MWNTPARRTQAGTKLGVHLEPDKSLNVSNPQLPVLLLLSLKMTLFHLATKELNQILQLTHTIPGPARLFSVNPLGWQSSFWSIRMEIKISEAHSITIMWFYKKWDSEGRWHHTLWGTSTTSEAKSWGGVGEEAVSFHPGLLEDVIAESEAGRRSCWLEGKWGPSSWKYIIWEDVSQWK